MEHLTLIILTFCLLNEALLIWNTCPINSQLSSVSRRRKIGSSELGDTIIITFCLSSRAKPENPILSAKNFNQYHMAGPGLNLPISHHNGTPYCCGFIAKKLNFLQ